MRFRRAAGAVAAGLLLGAPLAAGAAEASVAPAPSGAQVTGDVIIMDRWVQEEFFLDRESCVAGGWDYIRRNGAIGFVCSRQTSGGYWLVVHYR